MAPFPTRKLNTTATTIIMSTESTDSLESYPPSPILAHTNLPTTNLNSKRKTSKSLSKLRSTDPVTLYGQVGLPSAGVLGGLGRTHQSQQVVKNCLMDNHINNHTFINEKGFHNHLSHHLLAAYSLGAGPTLLQDLYDLENFELRPMPHLQPIEITEENWTDYLGDERLYPNFLVFFNTLIATPPLATSPYANRTSSVVPVLEKYLFGGEGEMLVRSISGAIHPLIHIGHGIEFNLDALVAEGLAQCCVHEAKTSALFSGNWPPSRPAPTSFQSTLFKLGYKPLGVLPIASPLDSFANTAATLPRTKEERESKLREGLSGFTILERIMNDPQLAAGETNSIDDDSKLDSTLRKRGERIKTWCEEWKFKGEKSVDYEDDSSSNGGSSSNGSNSSKSSRVPSWEEIVEKTEELIWMATVLYAATTRPTYVKTKLDFFIMHTLTSSLFLPSILEKISPHLRPYLLHSHFRIMISYWVSRARPSIYLKETLLAATAFPTPPGSDSLIRQGAVEKALEGRVKETKTTANTNSAIVEDATTPNVDSNGKLKDLESLDDLVDKKEDETEVTFVGGEKKEVMDESDKLKNEESSNDVEKEKKGSGVNPWGAIFNSAMDHPDDHVPKVIRTLAYAATHFGHTGPGIYSSGLQGTDIMDGSIFLRAAGITLNTMGWVREGDELNSWDRSVLGFDSAWAQEARSTSLPLNLSTSSNRSTSLDSKGKGKRRSDSTLTVAQEDEEILDAQAGTSSVVGGNIRSVTSSRAGSDIDPTESLSNSTTNLNGNNNGGGIEIRRRIPSEEEEVENRERKEREDAEEEERELMA